MTKVQAKRRRRRWGWLALPIPILFIIGLNACRTPRMIPFEPGPAQPATVAEILERVPPLRHDATGRMPMVSGDWMVLASNDTSFGEAKPWPESIYRELARRGLTHYIRPTTNYIPMALVIQRAGGRVIMLEGGPLTENGPYDFGGDTNCLHQFEGGWQPPPSQRRYPCLLATNGWMHQADALRELMQTYKAAGVTVDAVWLDWEGEPDPSPDRWIQARHCTRCRTMLPKRFLWGWHSWFRYIAYVERLRQELYSNYVAAPILEIFPDCWVTNYREVFSSDDIPTVRDFGLPMLEPDGDLTIGRMTASNPVAYGIDDYYYVWPSLKGWNVFIGNCFNSNTMERIYTRYMLAQFSMNAANAQRIAPEKKCVPWVCRYCPNHDDLRIPVLSRARYREILRHLWLRGADSMQIFNHFRPERPEIYLEELQDAVAIYDEMLAYVPFQDHGWIMNTEIPGLYGSRVIWSGLRLETQAVVRAFSPGGATHSFTIRPWTNAPPVRLQAPPDGTTYLLIRDAAGIRAVRDSEGDQSLQESTRR